MVPSVGEDVGATRTLVSAGGNVKMVQPLWKISQQYLKKLNVYLSYDPAIPLLCIYQEKSPHRLVHNMIAVLSVMVKSLKQLSTNR